MLTCYPSFTTVTEQEVIKCIKSLKSKSCGVDEISAFFVKIGANILATPLTKILNTSLRLRIFPDRWKRALVRPIPKIDTPENDTDYRPISILPVFPNIIEKLVTYQIINYLLAEKLQYIYQYMYKRNHSTTTAIFRML